MAGKLIRAINISPYIYSTNDAKLFCDELVLYYNVSHVEYDNRSKYVEDGVSQESVFVSFQESSIELKFSTCFEFRTFCMRV
jgi:hypothetical protein